MVNGVKETVVREKVAVNIGNHRAVQPGFQFTGKGVIGLPVRCKFSVSNGIVGNNHLRAFATDIFVQLIHAFDTGIAHLGHGKLSGVKLIG